MSWEDCGFKPGKINGPARCPRRCGTCDGDHHFLVDEGPGIQDSEYDPEAPRLFACKHCDATATMVPEDELD